MNKNRSSEEPTRPALLWECMQWKATLDHVITWEICTFHTLLGPDLPHMECDIVSPPSQCLLSIRLTRIYAPHRTESRKHSPLATLSNGVVI